MNIDVKRLPNAATETLGLEYDDGEDTVYAPAAVLRFTFTFDGSEIVEGKGGISEVAWYADRALASEFANAIVECLCDG